MFNFDIMKGNHTVNEMVYVYTSVDETRGNDAAVRINLELAERK